MVCVVKLLATKDTTNGINKQIKGVFSDCMSCVCYGVSSFPAIGKKPGNEMELVLFLSLLGQIITFREFRSFAMM